MQMINDFHQGELDIKRLNYGVITLIPKIKGASNIKQYRPICFLNVSFKFFTKLLMDRLTTYVVGLINQCQTTFIKGRYIVDGGGNASRDNARIAQKEDDRGDPKDRL
jgi:hypothetical protein